MQYSFTMTSRMIFLTGLCLLSLCGLLFLLGVEIGKKLPARTRALMPATMATNPAAMNAVVCPAPAAPTPMPTLAPAPAAYAVPAAVAPPELVLSPSLSPTSR